MNKPLDLRSRPPSGEAPAPIFSDLGSTEPKHGRRINNIFINPKSE